MWRGLILVVVFGLAGCATQPRVPTVYLSGLHKIELPLPQDLGRTVSLTQQVTVEFEGEVNDMLLAMDVASNEVSLVALTAFGAKLFSVVYQPPLIETEVSPLLKKQIRPEYVLADLMLSYWPTAILRDYLQRGGLSVEDDGADSRVIYLDDEVIIRIHYGDSHDRLGSQASYHNLKRGYRLLMRTLELE